MDVRINQAVWDAVSPAEQQKIIAHLQQHKVLTPGQGIVGDANVKAPAHDTPLYGATIGEAFTHTAMMPAFRLPVPSWVCRAACDAAAAAAAAACTATGPAAAACLVAIAAANQACREGC